MIICITGIDGSGKTLQAQRLVAQLRAAGHPAAYAWTGGRAYLTRPLIWAAKRLLRAPRVARGGGGQGEGGSGTAYGAYLASTRRVLGRPWLRAIWRHISLLEHSAEILAVTMPHLLRGRIVVCDRYIYDSLVGIAVLAGEGPAELRAAMGAARRYPVPRPELWVLIDLPAAVAFARRGDVVDVAFLERRAPLYRALAEALGARVVDGAGAPEAIAAAIWGLAGPAVGDAPAAPAGYGPQLTGED